VALIRITDASTQADIGRAINALRAQQAATGLSELKAEKQVEIDALLERWPSAAPG
jgi:hypothetical protein